MKKVTRWLSSQNWIYKFAIKIIANRIIHEQNLLTPEYLKSKGWVEEDGFWIEQEIKSRDKIWIQFEHHYFRIWHGKERTFVGLESKLEWFEIYYLINHDKNAIYELAGI